jgi:hypothetical protein
LEFYSRNERSTSVGEMKRTTLQHELDTINAKPRSNGS